MKFIIHYTKSRIRVLYASISKLVCICSKCSHDEIEECHQARVFHKVVVTFLLEPCVFNNSTISSSPSSIANST
jgi:hypothetical protein